MSQYIVLLVVIGVAALSMAWLPQLTKDRPFSYPIVFISLGAALYSLPLDLPSPNPLYNEGYIVRLTEMCVIVSLMGTGLKINRAFSWQHWNIPLRLVSVTMLLCIGATALLGWAGLGLSVAGALLLGAVLAPTDPVLAADVQVSPPAVTKEESGEEKDDHVRFSLTAEAGLNDGMAFPFTWLAVQIAVAAVAGSAFFWNWLWYDLAYRIAAGVGAGWVIGKGIAFLLYSAPRRFRLPKASDGFVALSATLLVYGLTELIHGYGFIAVFVAGLTISSDERHAEYVGSSRVDLQACKLEYSIVSPK